MVPFPDHAFEEAWRSAPFGRPDLWRMKSHNLANFFCQLRRVSFDGLDALRIRSTRLHLHRFPYCRFLMGAHVVRTPRGTRVIGGDSCVIGQLDTRVTPTFIVVGLNFVIRRKFFFIAGICLMARYNGGTP